MKTAGYSTTGPFEDKLPKEMTSTFLKHRVQRFNDSQILLEKFSPTKKISSLVEFDDLNKQWLILSSVLGKRDKSIIYNYNEISNFELLEDGETISEAGIGRALVGGALFGGTGAVVGGVTGKRKNKGVCNSLRIKITLNDILNPVAYIDLLKSNTKKDGTVFRSYYNYAQEILSVLDLITKKHLPAESSEQSTSADEIRKFKELFDEGIITQEEYDVKKKELLGL